MRSLSDGVKSCQALVTFNKSLLDAAEFYASHLERANSSILVSDAMEVYLSSKLRLGFRNAASPRHSLAGKVSRQSLPDPQLLRVGSGDTLIIIDESSRHHARLRTQKVGSQSGYLMRLYQLSHRLGCLSFG